MSNPKIGDLRVWHIPQVPGKAFYVAVNTIEEAKKILEVLAEYDSFQYVNRIKPDYCNVSGLEVYESGMDGEPSDWSEWYSEELGEDIHEWEQAK